MTKPIYVAVYKSQRDLELNESTTVFAADLSLDKLRARVNKYLADPRTIAGFQGVRLQIEPSAFQVNHNVMHDGAPWNQSIVLMSVPLLANEQEAELRKQGKARLKQLSLKLDG